MAGEKKIKKTGLNVNYLQHMYIDVLADSQKELLTIQEEVCALLNTKRVHFSVLLDENKQQRPQKKTTPREFTDPIPFPERGLTEEQKKELFDPVDAHQVEEKVAALFTEDDLRSALQEVISIKIGGVTRAQDLLKKYNVARVSQIPTDKINAFMKDCAKSMSELSKKGKH